MKNATAKPEILAPSGSLEAFFAAMEAGADAVYCGLKDFSARAKAKNLSREELERMTAYAHGLDRKVYVTLNTLVKEAELSHLVDTLGALEAMKVDALIIQDLGIWRLAREHFPGLELHSSTQMTVHNAAGVKMLEKMGFSRGVLARELSLAEIAEIRRQTTLDLEHFIHGALCFSFSGQCYWSSYLGGKSGNRGRCAQPCRRRYRYRQAEGYYFSTNDLSAIDLLPELAEAGVMSFKIEGRMKSAEYVANVVSAYRKALDAPAARRKEAVKEGKELLKSSFGRTPTQGFLPGGKPTDIAIPALKGSTGRFMGEIQSERGGEITFKTRDKLHVGDRLRVQPKTDKAGTAFTIKELRLGRRPVMKVAAGDVVSVPSTFRGVFKVGDTVFKVSSQQAFNMSDAACRRKLASAKPVAEPVRIEAIVTPERLSLAGAAGGVTIECDYDIETFPASEKALTPAILEECFKVTAGEPFLLENFQAENLPAVVIPPKRLKEIRRDFYREMRQSIEAERMKEGDGRLRSARAALLPARQARQSARRDIGVAIADVRDLHILNDPGVDRVVVTLSPGNVQGVGRLGKRQTGREDRVIWDIPFILFDSQWKDYRAGVKILVQRGFTHFRLNNLGHFPLFEGVEGAQLHTGYRLFTLNSQAALAWKELGVVETGLYIEDDRENLRDLLSRDTGLRSSITAYGSVPLITSRIAIRGVRPDTPVVSDRDDAYRVASRGGLSILTSDIDFSLLGALGELEAMGCGSFEVDLSHIGPFSLKGKKVLDALKRGADLPGTSKFNYEMAME